MDKIAHLPSFYECNQNTILQNENENCSLSIFGYSSKLYRDDQKAIQIDEGGHLISWCGDENIKIDRYDVRGYLSDLAQYEAEHSEYALTGEEKCIEELCDKERYRALIQNEEELELYKEEELKRTKQLSNSENKYGQVYYNYVNSKTAETISKNNLDDLDLEKYFIPTNILNIPSNITLPTSYNVSQIIKKTAMYVAEHGRQMEIIIKARQGNNEKFEFLSSESNLNSYYEYILSTIKNGNYKMESEPINIIANSESHQSTCSTHCLESAPAVPEVVYKQSQSCPYSILVNNIHNLQRSEEITNIDETDDMLTSKSTQVSENNITKVSKNTQIMVKHNKSKDKYKKQNSESFSFHKMVISKEDCNKLMKVSNTTLNIHCPANKDSNIYLRNNFQSIIETSTVLNELVECVSNDPSNYFKQNSKETFSGSESHLKILKSKKRKHMLESVKSSISTNRTKRNSLPGQKECINLFNNKTNKKINAPAKTTGIRFYIKKINSPAKLIQMSPLPVDSSSDEGDSLLEESFQNVIAGNLEINKNKTSDELHPLKTTKQSVAESGSKFTCDLKNEQRKLERKKRAKALVEVLKNSNNLKIKFELKNISQNS